jgi:excisionase family DNA binding protein
MEAATMERLTVTVEEAASILGIGRNSAYEAVRRGEIPVIRIGRRFLVPRAALERMLSEGAPSGADDTPPAGPALVRPGARR